MWEFLDRAIKEQENGRKKEPDSDYCYIEAGGKCPHCGQGKLDYNSLLNLFCPLCGYETGASFT